MTPRLDAIRECCEGALPGILATCAADGTPNVASLSQAEYVDAHHVALSYQFFNTTRRNILENPNARLIITHARTAERHRLLLRYLRTETAGPLFERMRARLAGIASHAGMSDVFRLLGADIYRVVEIERLAGPALAAATPRASVLAALRTTATRLAGCRELDTLLTETLASLDRQFDIPHAVVLLLDGAGRRLYTIASRGYARSGIGSEIPLGDGVIGVAASEATPVRVGYMTSAYAPLQTGGGGGEPAVARDALETRIPRPGLRESCSQLAVPIRAHGRVLGVLFVESPRELRFGYDDEDALVALAGQLGAAMLTLQHRGEPDDDFVAPAAAPCPADGAPLVVRHFAGDDSVFLDDGYLIKGVAGSIFWTLARDYADTGRSCFSHRALQRDPRVGDVGDDVEARLLLLRRRLDECAAGVRLENAGGGRVLLSSRRPLTLVEVADAQGLAG